MSKKQLVPVLPPNQGYDLIAKQYQNYHSHLDSFDNHLREKFLPRSLAGKTILDIGAGDGRIFPFFRDQDIQAFHGYDVSPQLLALHPKDRCVQTHVGNIETDPLPFETNSIDIATCFFTLEHFKNITDVFVKIYDVMASGSIFLCSNYVQHRSVVFNHPDQGKFKIKKYVHTDHQISKALEYAFFDVVKEKIIQDGAMIGYLYIAKKNSFER